MVFRMVKTGKIAGQDFIVSPYTDDTNSIMFFYCHLVSILGKKIFLEQIGSLVTERKDKKILADNKHISFVKHQKSSLRLVDTN